MDCIISLTSWKKRIDSEILQLTLYSLISQPHICDFKVILVLSTLEFPNRDADLPANLVKLVRRTPNAEILYVRDNTKAYKKYFPVVRKYPNVPIITVDDDSIAKPFFLPYLWSIHQEYPERVIYGYNKKLSKVAGDGTIKNVRYGVALYPPCSLYKLDEYFGRKYFKDMDDEFMKLLHVLNATHYYPVNAHDLLHMQIGMQNVAMGKIMHEQWDELDDMWNALWKAHPELHKIWKRNSKLSNW